MSYIESPLDRIVNVNFGAPEPTDFGITWNLHLLPPIDPPSDPFPQWQNGWQVMDVVVDHLPALSRTSLKVGVVPPDFADEDHVSGEFPDGTTGTISASADMLSGNTSLPLGIVRYSTTAQGNRRFGGAATISISIHLTLRDIINSPGVAWNANASFLGGRFAQLLSGETGGGASLNFNATAQLSPPSLSFTAG